MSQLLQINEVNWNNRDTIIYSKQWWLSIRSKWHLHGCPRGGEVRHLDQRIQNHSPPRSIWRAAASQELKCTNKYCILNTVQYTSKKSDEWMTALYIIAVSKLSTDTVYNSFFVNPYKHWYYQEQNVCKILKQQST